MARIIYVLLVVAGVCIAPPGCKSDQKQPENKVLKEQSETLNKMWLEGYGFNNPNAQRPVERREPVQNFDGSPYPKKKSWTQILSPD